MSAIPLVRTDLPKICHARVGQPVRLPNAAGDIEPEVFVICAEDAPGRRPGRSGQSQGLYDDQRKLFLVSMLTGQARPMPHLSSRAQLLKHSDVAPVVAPVLVPRTQAAEAVVVTRDARGREQRVDVDLANPDSVHTLLTNLAAGKLKVSSVTLESDLAEERLLLANWRAAVAAGYTLKSFEAYRADPT